MLVPFLARVSSLFLKFLIIFLPIPLPGIAFLVTSLLAPIARVHLVRQEFLPLSLAAGVFARWHQELGHDSSEPVCLVVGRAVVRAKGHGGLAWQWLMCRPEWWWAVNWPGGPVKETAGDGDLFCALAYPLMAWDPASIHVFVARAGCIWLRLLLLALRIKVRVDRWFQVSAVLNWILKNHASSWSSVVWSRRC